MTGVIRAVAEEDLPQLAWTGGEAHLARVRSSLANEVVEVYGLWHEGEMISVGALNFRNEPGAAYMWLLSTRPERRGQGFMQTMIRHLERRALAKGFGVVKLAVEVGNSRAARLYEFLGYRYSHPEIQTWPECQDGEIRTYTANCLAYEKKLA